MKWGRKTGITTHVEILKDPWGVTLFGSLKESLGKKKRGNLNSSKTNRK